MPMAAHFSTISSADSSTNTPTGTAPPALAAAATSAAVSTVTDRLDLGQTIIPMKLAPALTACSQSSTVVTPHTLTRVVGAAAAATTRAARTPRRGAVAVARSAGGSAA
jgi:hypothetical protein